MLEVYLTSTFPTFFNLIEQSWANIILTAYILEYTNEYTNKEDIQQIMIRFVEYPLLAIRISYRNLWNY